MKTTLRLINGLLVCGVALAMVSTLSAQTKQETAKVIRVKGAARVMVAGGAWQDIRVGTVIEPGSVIQSDIEGSSYVDIVLGRGAGGFAAYGRMGVNPFTPGAGAGGAGYAAPTSKTTVFRLYANTVLALDKLQVTETGAGTVTETELDLHQGRIVGNVKKLTAGSDFRIRYAKGVARIRGSILDLAVDKTKQPDQVHVVFTMATGTGEITFTAPDGNLTTQIVPPSNSFDSGPPPVVTPISPARTGELIALADSLSGPPIAVVHLPDPGQAEIQWVTTTVGRPRETAVILSADK